MLRPENKEGKEREEKGKGRGRQWERTRKEEKKEGGDGRQEEKGGKERKVTGIEQLLSKYLHDRASTGTLPF